MRSTRILAVAYLLSAFGVLRELYVRDNMIAFFVVTPILVVIWNLGVFYFVRFRRMRDNFQKKSKAALGKLEAVVQKMDSLDPEDLDELKSWFMKQTEGDQDDD